MIANLKRLFGFDAGRAADVADAGATLLGADDFRRVFDENLRACVWEPHPRYNVFTQYDRDFYVARRAEFTHKYRCFYSVSKTIAPRSMIEMGTSAGSSADAYLSATPDAEYLGLDTFGADVHRHDGTPWRPYDIARSIFADRGFRKCELIQVDLRTLDRLPRQADFVVVDAGHDFDDEYADLKLALTAAPTFIFVDDAADAAYAKPAIDKFLLEDVAGKVEYTCAIDYTGGGLVIKLKDGAAAADG